MVGWKANNYYSRDYNSYGASRRDLKRELKDKKQIERIFYGKEVFILRYFDLRIDKVSDLNIDKNYIFDLKSNKENKSLVNY